MRTSVVLMGFSVLLAITSVAGAQVVMLAHPETGASVVVVNEQAARLRAAERAHRKSPDGGWTTLLVSTTPGWGAAFCFKPRAGDVRFFVTEGKESGTEAITVARSEARMAARGTGETVYICTNAWNNKNKYPLDEAP